jgi:hypothetical protein
MNSPCIETVAEGVYRCKIKGYILRTNTLPIICNHVENLPPGPGDILHALIQKLLGENETLDCGCGEWINLMNQWGPQGCREHFFEIVDKLQAAANERKWNLQKWWARWATILAGLPILNWLGKPAQHKAIEFMVNRAIEQSKRYLQTEEQD